MRCAQISQFAISPGYQPNSRGMIGAVWASISVKNCGSATESFDVELRESVAGHPELSWNWTPFGDVSPGKSWGWNSLDNDSAALSTLYHVTLVVRDHIDKSILVQRSVDVTTPAKVVKTNP